jgi:3D (Asp-Asp-Asp) domain-containing protein
LAGNRQAKRGIGQNLAGLKTYEPLLAALFVIDKWPVFCYTGLVPCSEHNMLKVKRRALIGLFLVAGAILPYAAKADYDLSKLDLKPNIIDRASAFLYPPVIIIPKEEPKPWIEKKIMKITVTGYSSSHDETDDDPLITASGKPVRDGIVATNILPFGTKIKMPEKFGDKVFVVEDRMHKRFKNRIDVWFPSKKEALEFGKIVMEIEIES